MTKSQLYPLKINPETGEPFLQLPAPHENIILTPSRLSDKHRIVENLNDPAVHKTLQGPPFPYLMEHAEPWLASNIKMSDETLNILREAELQGKEDLMVVDVCPVRALREVHGDGTDLFIGDLFIHRCFRFYDLRDPEQDQIHVKENAKLPAGDPGIIWDVGYYIASSHQRKGVMSLALGTLIKEWVVPRMNAKIIRGSAFIGNIGSLKVFQKNGFEQYDQVEDCITLPEGKGGGKVGINMLKWVAPGS